MTPKLLNPRLHTGRFRDGLGGAALEIDPAYGWGKPVQGLQLPICKPTGKLDLSSYGTGDRRDWVGRVNRQPECLRNG